MSTHVAKSNFGPVRLVYGHGRTDENTKHEKRLGELYRRLIKKEDFYVGQLVKWKTGLNNRKRPFPGEPVVVTQILKVPVHDLSETNSASQFFREPLDLVIGIWDDGDLNELYVDSRRLEAYKPLGPSTTKKILNDRRLIAGSIMIPSE